MTDKRRLVVAIAAGGTAGHVNPALALADELRRRGHDVHFFGETRRLEGTLVPQAGFPFHPVHVTGFDRQRPWTLATALVHLAREERRLLKEFREGEIPQPDVAIGFGAYLELPLVRAAAKLGVPVALHEQNSVSGLANKQSAKLASLIALGQPGAEGVLRDRAGASTRIVFTGNPVRRSVLEGDRSRGRAALGIPEDATMLLVFGGSLGAKHLNERLAALKGDVLAAADVVLSRAGASSVAEIAALAVPSILVPYPFATADHQTVNARLLVDAGAATVHADADIDGEAFARDLLDALTNPARRESMRAAAKGLAQDRAAQHLADELESLTHA